MAVLTQVGRCVLAQAILDMTLFLAVGEGSADWDKLPPATTPADKNDRDAMLAQLSELATPVGVTRCREKYFVKPKINGDLSVSSGATYARSDEPTRFVFVRFQLDLGDANGTTLRESGIHVGTEFSNEVLPGQMFAPKEDVTSFGKMIHAARFNPVIRDGSLGQIFTYVLSM